MGDDVQRGADHIFTSQSFEVISMKLKSHCSQLGPHSNLYFLPLFPTPAAPIGGIFHYSPSSLISHICHPSLRFIFISIYPDLPPISAPVSLHLVNIYTRSALCVCWQLKANFIGKELDFHMKWDWNQLSKKEQMLILSWWHLLALIAVLHCLFHPPLPHFFFLNKHFFYTHNSKTTQHWDSALSNQIHLISHMAVTTTSPL